MEHSKINEIINLICHENEINFLKFFSYSRVRAVCEARQIFCYILKKNGQKNVKIGKILKQNHATVIHSIKVVLSEKNTLKKAEKIFSFAFPFENLNEKIKFKHAYYGTNGIM